MAKNLPTGMQTLATRTTSATATAPWWMRSMAPPTMVLSVLPKRVEVLSIG